MHTNALLQFISLQQLSELLRQQRTHRRAHISYIACKHAGHSLGVVRQANHDDEAVQSAGALGWRLQWSGVNGRPLGGTGGWLPSGRQGLCLSRHTSSSPPLLWGHIREQPGSLGCSGATPRSPARVGTSRRDAVGGCIPRSDGWKG